MVAAGLILSVLKQGEASCLSVLYLFNPVISRKTEKRVPM